MTGRAAFKLRQVTPASRHADHHDGAQALQRQRFAEQIPGADGGDHIAQRQHRVGDRHIDARQRNDPQHHRQHVAGQAADDGQLGRDPQADAEQIAQGQVDFADIAGAGLEQQLRHRVEQHAENNEAESCDIHLWFCSLQIGNDHAARVFRHHAHGTLVSAPRTSR
jgi:hypothetical protein